MNDFFSQQRRIEENQKRLKELYEQYKRTENYYPLFLAYLTAIAIYFFDFISLIVHGDSTTIFIVITSLTGISIVYTLFLIWLFFRDVPWVFDYLPNGVYDEFQQEIINDNLGLVVGSDDFKNEVFKRYIIDIETFVKVDSDIYIKKKERLSTIWKPMAFSILLYVSSISMYKTIIYDKQSINPKTDQTMSPTKIIARETKGRISDTSENSVNRSSTKTALIIHKYEKENIVVPKTKKNQGEKNK